MQNVAVPAQGKGLAFWGHKGHPAQSTKGSPRTPSTALASPEPVGSGISLKEGNLCITGLLQCASTGSEKAAWSPLVCHG